MSHGSAHKSKSVHNPEAVTKYTKFNEVRGLKFFVLPALLQRSSSVNIFLYFFFFFRREFFFAGNLAMFFPDFFGPTK